MTIVSRMRAFVKSMQAVSYLVGDTESLEGDATFAHKRRGIFILLDGDGDKNMLCTTANFKSSDTGTERTVVELHGTLSDESIAVVCSSEDMVTTCMYDTTTCHGFFSWKGEAFTKTIPLTKIEHDASLIFDVCEHVDNCATYSDVVRQSKSQILRLASDDGVLVESESIAHIYFSMDGGTVKIRTDDEYGEERVMSSKKTQFPICIMNYVSKPENQSFHIAIRDVFEKRHALYSKEVRVATTLLLAIRILTIKDTTQDVAFVMRAILFFALVRVLETSMHPPGMDNSLRFFRNCMRDAMFDVFESFRPEIPDLFSQTWYDAAIGLLVMANSFFVDDTGDECASFAVEFMCVTFLPNMTLATKRMSELYSFVRSGILYPKIEIAKACAVRCKHIQCKSWPGQLWPLTCACGDQHCFACEEHRDNTFVCVPCDHTQREFKQTFELVDMTKKYTNGKDLNARLIEQIREMDETTKAKILSLELATSSRAEQLREKTEEVEKLRRENAKMKNAMGVMKEDKGRLTQQVESLQNILQTQDDETSAKTKEISKKMNDIKKENKKLRAELKESQKKFDDLKAIHDETIAPWDDVPPMEQLRRYLNFQCSMTNVHANWHLRGKVAEHGGLPLAHLLEFHALKRILYNVDAAKAETDASWAAATVCEKMPANVHIVDHVVVFGPRAE